MTSTKSKLGVADAVKVTGEVVALVSPFGGPPDLQGDVIDPHAYDADISYWNASPNRLPVLISHSWADETANIGHVERLQAVPGYGLVATMKLDLTNPRAAYIHKLLSERRMVEFSIGYDSYEEKIQHDGSTLLQRLHIIEISVCLKGAAATQGEPDGRTQLLSVKSAKLATAMNGTVILDESDLDGLPAQRRDDIPVPFHVEARGSGFVVVDEATGEPINTYHTRAEAVAKLVEIRHNLTAGKSSNNDPAFMRRKIEAAAEGREFTPDDFTREKHQERNRPVVSNEVLYGDTITSLTSWVAEPDPAEGESFRVEFPIVVE
jgi:HK97 family phage prohead protease